MSNDSEARWRQDRRGLDRAQLLKRGAAGALGLSALGVLACGDDDDGGGTGTSASTVPKPTTPTGLLRVGYVSQTPKPFNDPDEQGGPGTSGVARIYNLYDSLVIFYNGEVKMRAAEAIETTDAITWDITLREGMTFHDGKPVEPADVVFTIKRKGEKNSIGANTWSAVKSVVETGPRNVRVTLASPDVTFILKFAQQAEILPRGYDRDKPIGSGPYKFESQTATKTVLVANQDWWGKELFGGPYIETVEIYDFKDETARTNALLAGQLDAIESFPLAALSSIKSSGKLKTVTAASQTFTPFVMNVNIEGDSPFKDERVRQAMRLIVDRKAMNDQVLLGQGVLGNDVFMPFDPLYVADEFPQREQDIEQAKSLLSAAGQSDLRLTLVTAPIFTGAVEQSQVLVEQAKAAGVTIRLKQPDSSAFFTPEAGYPNNPFSVSIGAGASDYLSYAQFVYAPGAFYDETHWGDPDYIRLFEEATKTIDDGKRGEIVAEMQRIDYDSGPYVIWGFTPIISAHDAKLQGVEPIKAVTGLNDARFNTLWVSS